jgi:GNAT superfamily N-acetyltransferase
MSKEELELTEADPRSPEAAALIQALSRDLAKRYDFADDGAGHFQPEDVLVPGSAFIIGWLDGRAVACGAFRSLGEGVCEIKRMFVVKECRGCGYSGAVLARLELLASAAGYKVARLETANRQPEAIRLYERAGYRRIPNFGIYTDSPRSICFERRLAEGSGLEEPARTQGQMPQSGFSGT